MRVLTVCESMRLVVSESWIKAPRCVEVFDNGYVRECKTQKPHKTSIGIKQFIIGSNKYSVK